MYKMSIQNHLTDSLPENSVCQAKDRHLTDTALFKPKGDSLENCVSDPPETPTVHNGNSNVHTSIVLEPSEYFFDDEFSVPFDANLRDEVGSTHRGLTEESDEGISSSGATHRGVSLAAVGHSRSDSCLFSPIDSGDSGQSGLGPNTNDPRIESPADKLYTKTSSTAYFQNKVCRPDSTSAPSSSRTHVKSADLFAILSNTVEADEQPENPLDGREFAFSPPNPIFISDPTSVTNSWMQAVMEGSCNHELKELLKRTAEALNYKLAWDDIQSALVDGNDQNNLPSTSSPRTSCLQRSTSHGNMWTTASLMGMRQTLAHISANISKGEKTENSNTAKQIRSVGVATTDSMYTMTQDNSAPDTTTVTTVGTTTWARVRSSRESLNSRKQVSVVEDFDTTECSTIGEPNVTVPLHQSTLAWRAIKMAAGNEMTTWGQLKRTASLATKQTTSKAPDNERNAHASLLSDWKEQPLEKAELRNILRSRSHRSPICNKVMHRYSGTLLEIFMRARAQDTITSSLVSSTRPCLLKQLGPMIASNSSNSKRTFSTRSLQVSTSINQSQTDDGGDGAPIYSTSSKTRPPINRPVTSNPRMWFDGLLTTDGISTFSTTSQETESVATQKRSLAFTSGNIPPPKPSAQPPVLPCRRSSMLAQFPPRRPTGSLVIRDLRRVGQRVLGPGGGDVVSPFALLTMSADPDSECMSRLRENDSPVYIKNPRSAIAYPGLGLLAVPKPSRIESATFLSQTLPDLSVLSQAAAEEARSGTPTMCRREFAEVGEEQIGRSNKRVRGRAASAAAPRRVRTAAPRRADRCTRNQSAHPKSPDNMPLQLIEQDTQSGIPHLGKCNHSLAVPHRKFPTADRSTSVPDISTNSDADQPSDLLMTVSLTGQETTTNAGTGASLPHTSVLERENLHSKKSVSFSGNMHAFGPLRRVPYTVTVSPTRTVTSPRCHSPDARAIPRHWGLYGQDPPPLAEFKPFDVAEQNDVSSSTRPSDVDIRYHAMVMDVIKAVQETVAYFCQPVATSCVSDATLASSTGGNRGSSSLSTLSRGGLLGVIFPLMTLLSDGLLPPARPLFTKPLRTRIWLLVEESCKQSAYLTGVAYYILNNALSQVKALPGAPSEKARFKAFVCVCLNNRALPMWLNCMVSNDPLLKRFYCEGAFIRQCRSTLRGLYADLLTHIEQLLAFPFNFDISVEARRPLVGADHHSSPAHNSLPRTNGVAAVAKSSRVTEKKPERSNIPNATVRTKTSSEAPKQTCSRALSATPACTTKTPSVSHLGLATSKTKAAATVDRTGQMPTPKRSTSIETQASSSTSSSAGMNWRVPGPGKTAPMRGKLRTALSTFRRSTGQGDVGSFHPGAVGQSKVRSSSSGIPVPSFETATSFPRTVRP
uniref:RUN domain-containing protein n=1 Tax=Schistocephalus solidus TaxID=70667 RepID=A0A0V0J5M7_SCHSO